MGIFKNCIKGAAFACFLMVSMLDVQIVHGAEYDPSRKKILVVMSYDREYHGETLIKEGIEENSTGVNKRYVYLDTKKHLDKGPEKAQKAYDIYKQFKPDVIISVDDHAQSMFILPYIKDKHDTPVVFCGVNDDASQYGYPTSQVTGILEKKHYKQSIHFVKLIVPEIAKIAVLYKENTSNITNVAQIKKEQPGYIVDIKEFLAIKTQQELLKTLGRLEGQVDALMVLNLAGITGYGGRKLGTVETMTFVSDNWPKPTIGASKREIEVGLLCAIAKSNKEQGLVAGQMAKDILAGKSVASIPVTQNRNGQRMINASTAKKLGIKLKPMALLGTELLQ